MTHNKKFSKNECSKEKNMFAFDYSAPYDPQEIFSKDYKVPKILPGYKARKKNTRDQPLTRREPPRPNKRQKRMSAPMPRFKEKRLFRTKMREKEAGLIETTGSNNDPDNGSPPRMRDRDLDAAKVLALMGQTQAQRHTEPHSVIKREPFEDIIAGNRPKPIKSEPRDSEFPSDQEMENYVPNTEDSLIDIKKEQPEL